MAENHYFFSSLLYPMSARDLDNIFVKEDVSFHTSFVKNEMKIVAKTLFTIIIIFSIAVVAGERKTRINPAAHLVSGEIFSNSERAGSCHTNPCFNDELKTKPLRRAASRKKTVTRPV